jgi:hypothetical protein
MNNNIEVKEKLETIAKRQNVELLDYKLYSNHPDDTHLYTVLCKKHDKKYITWVANTSEGCEGFGNGHYFEDLWNKHTQEDLEMNAIADYNNRFYDCRN